MVLLSVNAQWDFYEPPIKSEQLFKADATQ